MSYIYLQYLQYPILPFPFSLVNNYCICCIIVLQQIDLALTYLTIFFFSSPFHHFSLFFLLPPTPYCPVPSLSSPTSAVHHHHPSSSLPLLNIHLHPHFISLRYRYIFHSLNIYIYIYNNSLPNNLIASSLILILSYRDGKTQRSKFLG